MLAGDRDGVTPPESGVRGEAPVVGLASIALTAIRPSSRVPAPTILDLAPVAARSADGAATAEGGAPRLDTTIVALATVIGAASLGSALQHGCLEGGKDHVSTGY